MGAGRRGEGSLGIEKKAFGVFKKDQHHVTWPTIALEFFMVLLESMYYHYYTSCWRGPIVTISNIFTFTTSQTGPINIITDTELSWRGPR